MIVAMILELEARIFEEAAMQSGSGYLATSDEYISIFGG